VAWVSRNRSYNPSIVGQATGLRGLSRGRGLDVVPLLSINQRKAFTPSSTDGNREPSLDVFYRMTPSPNASVTLNTDFSATEVDDRQVNLTRFGIARCERQTQLHIPVLIPLTGTMPRSRLRASRASRSAHATSGPKSQGG
jgi:hypothetical protein